MFTKLYIDKFGSSTKDIERAFLVRTIICRTRFFSIFLHRFLKSDKETLHDHPWNFISFLIRGSFIEEMLINGNKVFVMRSTKSRRVRFANAETFHRIKLYKNYTPEEAPISICIAWNRKKNWSYMTESGPVHWRKYLKRK